MIASGADRREETKALQEQETQPVVSSHLPQEVSSSTDRLSFLSEAGRILSSSMDYETTLSRVASLAVAYIADYCVIDLVEEDGSVRRVATSHRDVAREGLVAELRRFPPDPRLQSGVSEVLRAGRAELVPEADDRMLEATTRGDEHLRIVRELGVRSYMIVPLIAHKHVFGAITLACTDSGRRYDSDDLTLAVEAAAHAALAIENSRLYRDAQAELDERKNAQEELDRKHVFLQLLLEVTTAANEAATFREALHITLERVRAYTRWPVGHVYLHGLAGDLKAAGLWSTDDPERFRTLREVTESLSFKPAIGLPGRVLATGRAEGIQDVTADPSFLGTRLVSDLGVKAAFAFPVVVGTEVAAVLEFFSGRSHQPDAGFLDVMAHVGTQLGRVVERERAREALRVGEEKFRLIAQNVRAVFWIANPNSERIEYMSPAYERIWGRPREELCENPMAWMEAILPEDRERVVAAEPLRAGHDLEYRIVRAEGEIRWIHSRAYPVETEQGDVYRLVGIAEDVTEERLNAEERARLLTLEREARERAEEAVSIRDDVMRMVSHDLRNPIATIVMAASLLSDVPLSDEERSDQIEVIHRTAEHLQRLASGLLDLKRIEANHGIPIEPQEVELPPLLEEGYSLFQPQAITKGVDLVLYASADLPHVRADSERLLQVLWNLTGNAIKFTPQGGRVVLRAEEHEEEILVSVTDTGSGIPPEDRERLFDPFWQAKRTARLGTGLGLPISKAIVEAHGGRIWVESTPGEGATFFFTLPKDGEGIARVPD